MPERISLFKGDTRKVNRQLGEALLSLLSGAAAQPVAGLAGLYGLATGGSAKAAANVQSTTNALTYHPRDPSALQALSQAIAPVTSRYEALKNNMGDSVLNRTHSPAAATAAYMIPDTLLTLLGARGGGVKGPTLAQMAERSAAPGPSGSRAAQIGAIRAWHGTPHDFDRFSMDKIGTGEGAQAYGHGLYFAGKKEVAEGYRKDVSSDFVKVADGRLFNPRDLTSPTIRAKVSRGDIAGATDEATRMKAAGMDWADGDLSKLNDIQGRGGLIENNGNLYNVELAPDEHDLLDWDAPLSEQPEKVRAVAEKLIADGLLDKHALTEWEAASPAKRDGGRFYELLRGSYNLPRDIRHPPAAASALLRQHGIPGIRYLDGGSRAAGDGSRNYVMFDDSLIKIKGKE